MQGRVSKTNVAKRFANPEVKGDMLSSFIEKGLSQGEAETETTVQMYHDHRSFNDEVLLTFYSVAGSDTTATAIRSTLLYIVTNPHVYHKLRQEIDSTHCKGAIISDAEARTLPYLQACIKEGLRMCPPVTSLLEKEAPPEGDRLNGRFVPGGTHVGFSVWGLFRDEAIFGHAAEVYMPERWLSDGKSEQMGENVDEKTSEMDKAWELVFGSGQTACLGRSIASIELNKVFFEVSLVLS